MSEPTGLDVAGNMAHEFIRFGERIGEARERERTLGIIQQEYNEYYDDLGIALAQTELDLLIKLRKLIEGENNE